MPARSAESLDPRSVVTPEAFHVSPEMLGLPLASPRRRLAAILLDLIFIGVLTAVTRSFALVLGIVIAVALVRMSMRRTPVSGNVFDRARRLSIGCLGLTVGGITLLIGLAVLFDDDLQEIGREFAEEAGVTIDDATGAVIIREPSPDPEVMEPRDIDAIRDGVTLYSTDEALVAYAELLRSGTDTEADRQLRLALEARLAGDIAADTLSVLTERMEQLEDDLRDEENDRQEAEEELQAAQSSGFLGWMRDFLDELGLGFGWAALYTTVLLAWTNGQTLGKRLLGIRVVRLDGQPITWWVGFERAGGYAAGFATGLLGFFQVYWDSNRQAIHDRIVGTVVIREGLERVQDWETAL